MLTLTFQALPVDDTDGDALGERLSLGRGPKAAGDADAQVLRRPDLPGRSTFSR